ncbi:unnamed protein product [Ixodes hexagonus]
MVRRNGLPAITPGGEPVSQDPLRFLLEPQTGEGGTTGAAEAARGWRMGHPGRGPLLRGPRPENDLSCSRGRRPRRVRLRVFLPEHGSDAFWRDTRPHKTAFWKPSVLLRYHVPAREGAATSLPRGKDFRGWTVKRLYRSLLEQRQQPLLPGEDPSEDIDSRPRRTRAAVSMSCGNCRTLFSLRAPASSAWATAGPTGVQSVVALKIISTSSTTA